ncbi:hypothetical protein MTO96_037492 [Rhipicephalus appendiculatus]
MEPDAAAQKDEEGSENMWLFCLATAAVLFMVTMFLVSLVMVSGGSATAEDCVDCNGQDLDGRSGSDGSSYPPVTYAGLTTKSWSTPLKQNVTTTSSAASETSSESESDASEASSTESSSDVTGSVSGSTEVPGPAGTAQKPLRPGSLLCTLSSGFKKDTYVFPPDGLCTIVTFNSLITADSGTLDPPYDDDFTYFLETSKGHATTEYGIGIDYKVTRNTSAMDALAADNDTQTQLEALWEQRIYHYGQVNTPLRYTGKDSALFAEDSAAGLQVFSTIMQSKRIQAKRPSYTILHFPIFTVQWAHQIANRLSGYSIDVFVAIGHHAEPDYKYTQCHMVPPTNIVRRIAQAGSPSVQSTQCDWRKQ